MRMEADENCKQLGPKREKKQEETGGEKEFKLDVDFDDGKSFKAGDGEEK